jgi:hypothetical protein
MKQIEITAELACHACGKAHPKAKAITLPDGSTVGNYSAEYLTYTEAKWVHSKAKSRFTYLEDVKRIRGPAAHEKLRQAMLKIHYAKKK